MKQLKLLTVIFVLIVAVGMGWKIYTVNQKIDVPKQKIYSLGEVAPLEKDFMNDSADSAEGYYVQVLESEVLPIQDFYKKYNLSSEPSTSPFVQYYYVVKVSLSNKSNDKGEENGISPGYMSLVGTNYFMIMDQMIFGMMNPELPGSSFSLKQNTCIEAYLPYAVNPKVAADLDGFQKDPPRLLITDYPTRKMIEIQ